MSLYAFHLGQIISTVFGQVDHDSRHGNAARTDPQSGTNLPNTFWILSPKGIRRGLACMFTV